MLVFYRAVAFEVLPTQAYNLFEKNCAQDDYLLKILKYADDVSTWAAAEIVTGYNSKVCSLFPLLLVILLKYLLVFPLFNKILSHYVYESPTRYPYKFLESSFFSNISKMAIICMSL